MNKAAKPRRPAMKRQVADLSNSEIVVIAAFRVGAAGVHADTEDIAVKANEIGPGRFTWKKYPEQINIDTVRKRLWDARKRGYLVGSERDGWLLTESGVTFARQYKRKVGTEKGIRLSLNERKWRRMEKARLLSTAAHVKFNSGEVSAITPREAQGFFRIDAYSPVLSAQLSKVESRMAEIDRLLTAKPASKLPRFTDEQIAEFLRQESKAFCDALTSDPEFARQEIQKRIKRLVLTPKDTPDRPVLEVSGDVALLRTGDVLVQSPMDGTSQHYIGASVSLAGVILNPSVPLAA